MCIYDYRMAKQTQKKTKAVHDLACCCDAKLFKSLSEPVRIEILKYLLLNGRSDIKDIAKKLPQDRSVISRHLTLMQEAEILKCEKVSRHVYYSINDNTFLRKIMNIATQFKKSITECCG
jgi:ArsR family transcriptional regulator, zinc-responsive transcriptional repressor